MYHPSRFWMFNLFLRPLSALSAWLCHGARGSILIASVSPGFHRGANAPPGRGAFRTREACEVGAD